MSITPEVGEEGGSLRVTLKLSRPLTADEKWCYPSVANAEPNDEVCIEGGIIIWDTYNDHIQVEENGFIPSDQLFAFKFRTGETEKRLNPSIANDACITPGRTIRIAINTSFRSDTYGYTIDTTEHSVRIAGDDETNGQVVDDGGKCLPVDGGATEDIPLNSAPAFGKQPISLSVDENTAAGEDVGSPVTATDPDEDDTLEYSLTGTDANHFYIDPDTGQIETDGALDYETKHTYHLAVSVTDGMDIDGNSDSEEDDSIDVTINVDNVNEPPVFDPAAPTALNVMENTAANVDIGSPVTATDPDDGDTVSYSLDTDDGASFGIDDSTGQIKTKASLMDESQDSYTVTVTASDDNSNEAEHEVTITVTDANDPPAFTDEIPQGETSITRSVAENTTAGDPVGDPVAATDEESDTLTYSLSGTDAASFDFETGTGQIKVKDALDYEGGTTSYSVTVSVTDSLDVNSIADTTEDATINVTINVTDVNEPPAFAADAPTTLEVAENTAANTDIGSAYTATDPESDTPLTYSLGGADAASFGIDEFGQLKTKAALDFETKASYSVTIQVSDGKDADGTAEDPPVVDTTLAVTITVTDADDPGSLTLSSQMPIVGSALTATLTDQDDGVTGETWEWEISDDGQTNWSTISGQSTSSYTPVTTDEGKYLRASVDYTDAEGSGKSAESEASDAVDLRPATNENPEYAEATATREIAENTPAGENIGDPYTATHADSVGTLVYSLGGTDAAEFDLDTTTGQLKTKTVFDYETPPNSYTVTVSASDGMDAYSNADTAVDDTIGVTITVTDIVIPAIPDAPTVTATPGAAAGLTVDWTAVTPTETAPVNGYNVQYRGKDDQNPPDWGSDNVTVSGVTAIITDLDYGKTYEVQVRSKNSEGESAWSPTGEGSIPRRLNVSFSSGTYTVSEGSSKTITVNVSPATDRDLSIPVSISSSNAESGDYSPTGTTTLTFASSDTSKSFPISTTDDSDRSDETVNLSFGLLPFAVGRGSQSTATLTINDTTPAPGNSGGGNNGGGGTTTKRPSSSSGGGNSYIPPQANQAPTFNDDASTERWIAEKSPEGTNIGHPVRATDPDKNKLTFSLGGTDAASFSMDTSNGQLKTKAELDFEIRDTYSVTVSVTDGQGGTDSIAVTIKVTDVVEVPVTDEDHQVVVLINPDDETDVSTPDGDVTVTFPEDTGTDPYFVKIDSSPDNCDWDSLDDPPADQLQACVTIEVFDTQGNPIEGDDILDPSITFQVVLDPDDIGTDTIHSFVESGNGWTSVTFTQSTDSDGNITITIGGVTGPGTYGVGSNEVQQLRSTVIPEEPKQSEQQATVQIPPTPEPTPQPTPQPTPEPTPEPTPQPTPEPTPQPTPEPTPQPTPEPTPQPTPQPTPEPTPQPTPIPDPTPVPQPIPEPTPEPMATPEAQEQDQEILQQSLRVAPPDIVDLGNASGPDLPQVTFFGDAGDDILRMRLWPVILMALGIAMELIALGLFLKEKEADKRRW